MSLPNKFHDNRKENTSSATLKGNHIHTLISFVSTGVAKSSLIEFSPAITCKMRLKSQPNLVITPACRYCVQSGSSQDGNIPSFGINPPVGLCPNTPLKRLGIRMEPAMSEPTPNTEEPLPFKAPFE